VAGSRLLIAASVWLLSAGWAVIGASSAQDAPASQTAAGAADQKAVEAQQMAKNAEGKISGVESNLNQKISNIDSYKPVENASVTFKFNHSDLSDEAKASLDQLAAKVKDSKGYVLEIQGFTDSTGTDAYNLVLSQKWSENVVRYLSQQHQIPLFRMFILGLGEAKQIEDNKTKKGRAANRRVEITLLKREIVVQQAVSR